MESPAVPGAVGGCSRRRGVGLEGRRTEQLLLDAKARSTGLGLRRRGEPTLQRAGRRARLTGMRPCLSTPAVLLERGVISALR
jgi:hypothetical protein